MSFYGDLSKKEKSFPEPELRGLQRAFCLKIQVLPVSQQDGL